MPKFTLKNLTKEQKRLRKRILEISHDARLSHLGSCLTAIDVIDAIYTIKKPTDKFVLSNGHAGIAWYVILEKHGFLTDKEIKKLHVHPDRNPKFDIHVSTGSLGQGLPIALGMALANRKQNIYCMLSDGECAEGSIWEAMRVVTDYKVNNLKIIVNANGWSAYDKVNITKLAKRIKAFGFEVVKLDGHDSKKIVTVLRGKYKKPLVLFATTTVDQFPFLKGQEAHYYVMQQKDFDKAMEELK